eukprot:COSAG02_NODE_8445_length_2568_cov_257.801134_2_plen_104_part_00
MSTRKRSRYEWDEGCNDLAEFCSTHLKNIGEASRGDLRAFWAESPWLEGQAPKEMDADQLAQAIEEAAYKLWLEDSETKCAEVSFEPPGMKKKTGKAPNEGVR